VQQAPVIAIDGPSGSGKGTVARAVADALAWHLLDSGALYRLAALAALRAGVPLDDALGLARIAGGLDVKFQPAANGGGRIELAGEDVAAAIRSEACASAASQVAVIPELRTALVALQRSFQRPPGLVADGRDMGSVIFPEAELKIFLTASAEERARRRHKQLKAQGMNVSLAALSADISQRDQRDASRPVAPLRPTADAVLIDSTGRSVAEVVADILAHARKSIAGGER
jgi:cytidylate kinase